MKLKDAFFADKSRWISGLALTIAAFLVIFSDSFLVVWFFFGAMYLRAVYEAGRFADIQNNVFLYIASVLVWTAAYFYAPAIELAVLALLLTSLPIMFGHDSFKKISLIMLYPTISTLALLSIYANPQGDWLLLTLLLTVAATDMGAYFGGRSYGKRKLASSISPNKTIEGAATGLVFGVVFGTLSFLFTMPPSEALSKGILISFIVSLFSIFGDLFESYIKRCVGKKDSGGIFPGHGGVLDRADGVLFAAVAMYFIFKVMS